MASAQANGNIDNGEDGEPPRIDMEAHQRTFDSLMTLTKYGTVIVALILIGMAVFLL